MHIARGREKKIQNKLFILKERDYKKIYKPTISLEEIEFTLIYLHMCIGVYRKPYCVNYYLALLELFVNQQLMVFAQE